MYSIVCFLVVQPRNSSAGSIAQSVYRFVKLRDAHNAVWNVWHVLFTRIQRISVEFRASVQGDWHILAQIV